MTQKTEFPTQNNQSANEAIKTQGDQRVSTSTQPPEPAEHKGESKNVMGFITAGIPLLGGAFFYLVGWTYISNWYGYYGMSISQVDLPTQHILVNSVSVIKSLLLFLVAVTLDYAINILRVARKSNMNQRSKNSSLTIPGGIFQRINLRSVMIIFNFSITILFVYYLCNHYRNSHSFRFSNLPEELFWFYAVILATFIFYFKRLDQTLNSRYTGMISGSVIIISILFSSVPLAALDGIANAVEGKQGAWRIPEAYIFSQDPVPVLDEYIGDCDSSGTFWYGPFGLVAENDHTVYVVPWPEENKGGFIENPRLFILERDEQTTFHIFMP